MINIYNIILASASPRRKSLLSKISNVNFEVILPQADAEKIAEKQAASMNLSAEDLAVFLCVKKAESVYNDLKDTAQSGKIILSADTIVTLNGKIYGKPTDSAQAESYIKQLSGKTHQVITAFCLTDGVKTVKNFEKTYVTFGAFNDKIVYNYIKSGKSNDKAGAYGIQDPDFAPMIKKVDGDIDNVIGLPVSLIEKTLKENF